MPIKIIPEIGITGGGVKKSQIKALSDNYFDKMKKKKKGVVKDLDKKGDAKSAWFTKEKLDELFILNGCTQANNQDFGLRIYFGVHETGILRDPNTGVDIDPIYDNQQMVVLVVTKKHDTIVDEDLLSEAHFVEVVKYPQLVIDPGQGLDHGKLCPPEICTGAAI